MKALVWLLVLVVVVGGGFFLVKSMAGFDPAKQAEQFRSDVRMAKTWQDVLAIEEPSQWATINLSPNSLSGVSAPVRFDRKKFEDRASSGSLPADGFVFYYSFTAEDAIDITFDGSGNLASVDEALTGKDLLDGSLTPN